jgi:hypothetical protein
MLKLTKDEIKERGKLVKKVITAITEEPKRLNMVSWVRKKSDTPKDQRPACDTVACVAGWAVAVAEGWNYTKLYKNRGAIESMARDLLGLDPDFASAAYGGKLFYPIEWPHEWRSRLYRYEAGTKAYAKVVASYAREFFKNLDKEQLKK